MSAINAAVEFGRLVRSIRKARKLKSWKVAEQVGIEVKHLGRIERGEKRPSFELIVALADALSVSPAEFFEFEPVAADSKSLKREIALQLKPQDLGQLKKARDLLTILFDPR
jgi:transcriptional regulator with XRE-family HTH domain